MPYIIYSPSEVSVYNAWQSDWRLSLNLSANYGLLCGLGWLILTCRVLITHSTSKSESAFK